MTSVILVSTEREWAIKDVFRHVAQGLNDQPGIQATLYPSEEIPKHIRQYDKRVIHWCDTDVFSSKLWREIREDTWVCATGPQYDPVPWDKVDNAVALSQSMEKHLPMEASVARAGVDPDVYYPMDVEKEHKLGMVANSNKIEGRTEGIERYNIYHHDGFHDEYLSLDEMRHLYNSFEAYCSLTNFEAAASTIIEAAACGTPVVSTATGIAADLDGVELVPYDPHPEQLQAAAHRADPFVDEILDHWTWSDTIPEWESALGL